jgi:hypothetical protein
MIFVDTSAWLAVSDVRDGNHARAIGVQKELVTGRIGRLITTDYILDETLTLMRKRTGLDGARRFLESLEASRSVQVIWVGQDQFQSAKAAFLSQGTRSWSFTDCTSFVIMRELGITTAFAFDSDFEQAGFEVRPGDH